MIIEPRFQCPDGLLLSLMEIRRRWAGAGTRFRFIKCYFCLEGPNNVDNETICPRARSDILLFYGVDISAVLIDLITLIFVSPHISMSGIEMKPAILCICLLQFAAVNCRLAARDKTHLVKIKRTDNNLSSNYFTAKEIGE